MPRTCGRQRHRASIPASNPFKYFRRTITFLILDHLLSELDKWFSSHKKTTSQGLYLVPSVLVTEDLATVSSVVMKVGELYAVDLSNVSSLAIHNWYTKWKSEEKDHGSKLLPSTLSPLTRISSFYPNIKALVTIHYSLPVTSCKAERSFSWLKRIKSLGVAWAMNVSQAWLYFSCIEEVIDEFSKRHPRRSQLSDSTRLFHFFSVTLHMHNESLTK